MLALITIVRSTLVEFRPLKSPNMSLSLYNHFEHQIPVFKFLSDTQATDLPGFYSKAMIYKLKNGKYSIQYDNMKMYYDERNNNLDVCDLYYRCLHTDWSLDRFHDDDKVRLNNECHCITYKNDKTLIMQPCDDARLDQVFIIRRKKLKLYCHYDENHSDEITLDVF